MISYARTRSLLQKEIEGRVGWGGRLADESRVEQGKILITHTHTHTHTGMAGRREPRGAGKDPHHHHTHTHTHTQERLADESRVEQGKILMKVGVTPHRAAGLYFYDNPVPELGPTAQHTSTHELAEGSADRDQPPAGRGGEGGGGDTHAGVEGLLKGDVQVCVVPCVCVCVCVCV